MTVGDRLKQALRDQRRSVHWLSQTLEKQDVRGASLANVYRYTSGMHDPPLDFLREAAKLLNVDEGWLVTGKGERRPTDPTRERGSTADRLRAALVAEYARTEGEQDEVEASMPPPDVVFRWAREAVRPLVREALSERRRLTEVRALMLAQDWPEQPQPHRVVTKADGHKVLRSGRQSRAQVLALLARMDNNVNARLRARQEAELAALEMQHRKTAPRRAPKPRRRGPRP